MLPAIFISTVQSMTQYNFVVLTVTDAFRSAQ